MIIRTQNGEAIYDFSKMYGILSSEDGIVFALSYGSESVYKLGEYENRERANEVIEEIFALIDVQDKYDMPTI